MHVVVPMRHWCSEQRICPSSSNFFLLFCLFLASLEAEAATCLRSGILKFRLKCEGVNGIVTVMVTAVLPQHVNISDWIHAWLMLQQITSERSARSHQCDGRFSHCLIYRVGTLCIYVKVPAWQIALCTWPHVPCCDLRTWEQVLHLQPWQQIDAVSLLSLCQQEGVL